MTNYKAFALGAMTTALCTLSTVAFAANEPDEAMQDGKLVSISGEQLTMTAKTDGKPREHVHRLAPKATMTLDGKPCKADELRAGIRIRVTTRTGNKAPVTNVEAIDKQALFANTHEGTVVSISSNKLVMTGQDGREHAHSVSADTKVTCDGKVCKVTDLKAGTKIRVTTKKLDAGVAVGIEAIDLNPEFASL